MAYRRAGLQLTAPSVPLFVIALVLAVLAWAAHYFGVAIPVVSERPTDVLTAAFVIMTAGVVMRGV